MRLPASVREQFVRHGRNGGHVRAAGMSAGERRAVARNAAMARWIRHRFGAASFGELGLPGGDTIDAGLRDLAHAKVTVESLVISLAAPRLRREGVPVGEVLEDPEDRLYELLCESSGDLAAFRYRAHLEEVTSFANACGRARLEQAHP